MSIKGCLVYFIVILFLFYLSYANSVDPDQSPCYAPSDLGLLCLPMFFLCEPERCRCRVKTLGFMQKVAGKVVSPNPDFGIRRRENSINPEVNGYLVRIRER